jgi:CRISPR-associated protein Cmr1
MEELSYRCEVITPMFVAGADQETAELREAPIKGLLRFWWRATGEFDNLNQMKEREEEVFGSKQEKSRIQVLLNEKKITTSDKKLKGDDDGRPDKFRGDILKYLSYGCHDRPYIQPGSRFNIKIRLLPEYRKEVERALYAFYWFGGIGSKSRNGFGSFSVEPKIDPKPHIEILSHTIDKFTKINKRQTLFSSVVTYPSWEKALSKIGYLYWEARMSVEKRHQFDQRAKISKPIIARNEHIPSEFKDSRQAKPFFLHVSKTSDGTYRGEINFFPTRSMMDKNNPEEYDHVFKVFIDTIKKTGEMK